MKRPRAKLKLSPRDCAMGVLGIVVAFSGVWLGASRTEQPVPLAAQSPKLNIPWLPDTVRQWQQPIGAAAEKYNIDPELLAIIITLESGGYPKAQSEVGAKGLMQIMPETAQDIAARHLQKPRKTYDLTDPNTSIEFGAAYLALLRDEFGAADQKPGWDKTVELIAAGYNGGPGAANSLEKGEGLRSLQTLSYSRDACNMWRERHAAASPTFERWKERGGDRLLALAQKQHK